MRRVLVMRKRQDEDAKTLGHRVCRAAQPEEHGQAPVQWTLSHRNPEVPVDNVAPDTVVGVTIWRLRAGEYNLIQVSD